MRRAHGQASAQGLPLIRDTEIEALLNDYSQKIFKAAGLGTGRVTVRIINNDSFNAFVVDGRNVFMHTGTLMQSNTPNEVIGVLAHESGHIAGGHMAALRGRIAKDQTRALLIQLLGIGAMIGGAVSGGDSGREISSAGQGVMMGGNELIMRGLTAERRSAGIGGRPGRPVVSQRHAAVRSRHADDVRALRRPGACSPTPRETRSRAPTLSPPTVLPACASWRSRARTSRSRIRPSCSSATT